MKSSLTTLKSSMTPHLSSISQNHPNFQSCSSLPQVSSTQSSNSQSLSIKEKCNPKRHSVLTYIDENQRASIAVSPNVPTRNSSSSVGSFQSYVSQTGSSNIFSSKTKSAITKTSSTPNSGINHSKIAVSFFSFFFLQNK